MLGIERINDEVQLSDGMDQGNTVQLFYQLISSLFELLLPAFSSCYLFGFSAESKVDETE